MAAQASGIFQCRQLGRAGGVDGGVGISGTNASARSLTCIEFDRARKPATLVSVSTQLSLSPWLLGSLPPLQGEGETEHHVAALPACSNVTDGWDASSLLAPAGCPCEREASVAPASRGATFANPTVPPARLSTDGAARVAALREPSLGSGAEGGDPLILKAGRDSDRARPRGGPAALPLALPIAPRAKLLSLAAIAPRVKLLAAARALLLSSSDV